MLKITKEFNLDHLNKYGFKCENLKHIDIMNAFEFILEKEYLKLFWTKSTSKEERLFIHPNGEITVDVQANYFYGSVDSEIIDTLYDMIKAGLVEKVEE